MNKVKTKIWRVVCQKHAYYYFYMVIIKMYILKNKFFDKFPERLE